MAWLLDTNVLSELRKPRPDPNVRQFAATAALRGLTVVSRDTLHYERASVDVVNPWR